MHFFRRLPISRKILLGILPLFLLFISLSVALQNHFQEQEMMEQAQLSAHTYADIIKESLVSMMVNNYKVDESFLERVKEVQQFDTVHILVNDLRLREELLTPERIKRLETKYKTLRPHDGVEASVLDTGQPVFSREGDRFRGVIPFTATDVCQKCHAVPVGYTLGATDLHISFERFSRAAEGNWKRSFLIFVLFTGVAITVATLTFTRFISKPVDRLVAATREISTGNLNYAIPGLPPAADRDPREERSRPEDELVFLTVKFDEMRSSLKEKIAQLDRVNVSLSERNKEVEEALRQLRQAQEELVRSERLAVTGKMTAQLSHEINNPIHNIQSLLESSLRKINGNIQARELITVALEEVTRMAKLTRHMLEFYRGSVVEMEKEPIDIASLLDDIARTNRAPLHSHGIQLVMDKPAIFPCVQGSRDKLKQVFLNLILNARDAMPNGGMITIRVVAIHGQLNIEIADTGVGIPPEHMGRIFEAFFTTKKEVSGVGLGLAVTYGIIQQHQGTITVKSTVGKGTTFTIQLPLTIQQNGEQHDSDRTAQTSRA
ncbi:MAG TPA: ATP-binding protein [Bacteroidota bacterium]|nr:ATP-binding protein [Bacteroidota bacterium]